MLGGEDRLIGSQVLQLLNSVYQQNSDLKAVYTSSITTFYSLGPSKPLENKKTHLSGKEMEYFLGPTKSWFTEVMRKIAQSVGKEGSGEWKKEEWDNEIEEALIKEIGR